MRQDKKEKAQASKTSTTKKQVEVKPDIFTIIISALYGGIFIYTAFVEKEPAAAFAIAFVPSVLTLAFYFQEQKQINIVKAHFEIVSIQLDCIDELVQELNKYTDPKVTNDILRKMIERLEPPKPPRNPPASFIGQIKKLFTVKGNT